MAASERLLFVAFLKSADTFLEFGSGGSTCLAATKVRHAIISVDSSAEWLRVVATECINRATPVRPHLMEVNIGPVGEWGWPIDTATRDRWPIYYNKIWSEPSARSADLFLIDGRFRVACFMSILIHCRPGSVILFHDFASRRHYHVVREFAREIAVIDDLSAFMVPADRKQARIFEVLEHYKYEPS